MWYCTSWEGTVETVYLSLMNYTQAGFDGWYENSMCKCTVHSNWGWPIFPSINVMVWTVLYLLTWFQLCKCYGQLLLWMSYAITYSVVTISHRCHGHDTVLWCSRSNDLTVGWHCSYSQFSVPMYICMLVCSFLRPDLGGNVTADFDEVWLVEQNLQNGHCMPSPKAPTAFVRRGWILSVISSVACAIISFFFQFLARQPVANGSSIC